MKTSSRRISVTPSSPVEDEAAPVRLRVQDANGQIHIIESAERSEADAIRMAVARGMQVLAIESKWRTPANASPVAHGSFPVLMFSQELLALLEAGLNLTEALAALLAKETQPNWRSVLQKMMQALQEGISFSDVLGTLDSHFPQVYVATVRAAERTGDLPSALSRYIAYQLQFDRIRTKLLSAAIYPAMLLVVGAFVTLFLLGYVVPKFSAVYESSGRDLPWLSSALLMFGNAVYKHWPVALFGVTAMMALLGWTIWRPQGRSLLLHALFRLPWLQRKAAEFRLARFYRAVSMLLTAGIALPRAMGMVTGLLLPEQQQCLASCRAAVEQGRSLSTALQEAGLSSPVADSLIQVGERSGQLADMLERAARFHDDTFTRWIDRASRLLEPVLMTVIGLVIGAVVVLMYMPIFELAGSLQ